MGSDWHVADKQITSAYRAFSPEKIVGDLGVHIGFNHVNVSLRCETPSISTVAFQNAGKSIHDGKQFGQHLQQTVHTICGGADKILPSCFAGVPFSSDFPVDSWDLCFGMTFGLFVCLFFCARPAGVQRVRGTTRRPRSTTTSASRGWDRAT